MDTEQSLCEGEPQRFSQITESCKQTSDNVSVYASGMIWNAREISSDHELRIESHKEDLLLMHMIFQEMRAMMSRRYMQHESVLQRVGLTDLTNVFCSIFSPGLKDSLPMCCSLKRI